MTTKESYKLTCLFEGSQNTFTILIPHTANVSMLRELIYNTQEEMGIFYNVDPTNLICSKVCQEFNMIINWHQSMIAWLNLISQVEIDLQPLEGHLFELSLNDSYQPSCLVDPCVLIQELWEEQPPCQHIHIFVKIHKRPSSFLSISEFLCDFDMVQHGHNFPSV